MSMATTDTPRPETKFDAEAFAMNVARAMESGTMPLDYGTRLPEGDLDALVAFVVDAVGEAGP